MQEAIKPIAERIKRVQDYLGEQVLLENVSSYLLCPNNEMTELEFIREVSTRADCNILLDINDIFVSNGNHQQDNLGCFDVIPAKSGKQIHLVEYEIKNDYLLDSHDHPVTQAVWNLF